MEVRSVLICAKKKKRRIILIGKGRVLSVSTKVCVASKSLDTGTAFNLDWKRQDYTIVHDLTESISMHLTRQKGSPSTSIFLVQNKETTTQHFFKKMTMIDNQPSTMLLVEMGCSQVKAKHDRVSTTR